MYIYICICVYIYTHLDYRKYIRIFPTEHKSKKPLPLAEDDICHWVPVLSN